MGAVSAGLLTYKVAGDELVFLLVHPGGPYFKNKDHGFWSIPKGLVDSNEDLLEAAKREFQEETGMVAEGPYYNLGEIKQKSGKLVCAWSFLCPTKYADWDPNSDLASNTFSIQWPPRSGRYQEFPEADGADWFNYQQASSKLIAAQIPFLEAAISAMSN